MIRLNKVCKAFNNRIITNNLDLEIEDGEFLAIIGRSGEGKSVLLKQIIGLLKPDSGNIFIGNQDITKLNKKELVPVFQKCGYVFQFAALLDSLNVLENVGITLLEEEEPLDKIQSLVIEKLRSVGLSSKELLKYPSELSGGMRKRVGLARTLMQNPEILIYDEPTTGLDPIAVRIIHELIAQTHKEIGRTTIVISHDVEIFKYATQVAMLYEGKIIYKGSTAQIWDCDNPYVYQFIRGLEQGPIQTNT